MPLEFKIGDKVLFDAMRVDEFKRETSNLNKDISIYQKLIIGGVNQIGIVLKIEENLTWVKYPDGWDIPVPTKYLLNY